MGYKERKVIQLQEKMYSGNKLEGEQWPTFSEYYQQSHYTKNSYSLWITATSCEVYTMEPGMLVFFGV